MRAPTWLAAVLVAIAAALVPAPALGYDRPASAEPAPGSTVARAPDEIRVALDVAVEDEFLELRATTPGGTIISGPARRDPLDDRAIVAPVDAPPGIDGLVVTWRALTQDGHAAGGRYGLGIGAPAPTVGGQEPVRPDDEPLAVAARLLMLAGPLGILGLVVLAAGVVGPAVAAGGVAPPGESAGMRAAARQRMAEAVQGVARGWWIAWASLLGAWVLALLLTPLVTLRALREGPSGLGDLIIGTDFGLGWRLQAAGLVVAAITGAVAWRAAPAALPDAPLTAVGLGFGPVAALAAISATGHASTGGDATINITIDVLHNLATAAWIGGLLGLAVLVAPAVAALGVGDRTRLAAGVVVRFSALALTCVGVLVVTGVYRAIAEVSIDDLLDTDYGRALLVKLGLFAVLLVGGAYNRMVVHPRLERAALGLDPDDRGAADALRISVRAELAVAAALLTSVAVLISLAPPA